jgi:hypothetical protein
MAKVCRAMIDLYIAKFFAIDAQYVSLMLDEATAMYEPREFNFDVDHGYFVEVVWPALAHLFPTTSEGAKCHRTWSGIYEQSELDGNRIIGNWQLDWQPREFRCCGWLLGLRHDACPGSQARDRRTDRQ